MQVKTNDLKALLLAAGKKDIRYYLNGVHINDRHMVASDGHRMHAIAHGGEWTHGPVTIPREAVELAVKAKTLELTVTGQAVGAVTFTPVDGRYPDYLRIIPAHGTPVESSERYLDVNPDYLRDAVTAIKLTGWKGEHPSLARVGAGYFWCNGHMCVVVMPVRTVNPKTGETGYQLERLA